MTKQERGTRNRQKLATIQYSGKVTFWNPTENQTSTWTIHYNEASLVTQLYALLKNDQKPKLDILLATAGGYMKAVNMCYDLGVTYKVTGDKYATV